MTDDQLAPFARTGGPASGDLTNWRPYGDERATMVLDATCVLEEAPMEPERAFWDTTRLA